MKLLISPVSILIVLVLLGLIFLGTRQADAPEFDAEVGGTESAADVQEEGFVIDEAVGSLVDKLPLVGAKTEIYDGITVSNSARIVNLSNQGLTGSLKAEIRHVSTLRVLDLSGNNFTGLPAEVGQLTNLETLNLSNNQFTGLPHELGNLQSLRLLDVTGNNISRADMQVISEALPGNVTILSD